MTTFKKLLQHIRVDLGLTQAEMASELKISSAYLSSVERGERDLTDSLIDKIYNCYEQYIDVDLRIIAIIHNQQMSIANLPVYQQELLAILRFTELSEEQCLKIKDNIK